MAEIATHFVLNIKCISLLRQFLKNVVTILLHFQKIHIYSALLAANSSSVMLGLIVCQWNRYVLYRPNNNFLAKFYLFNSLLLLPISHTFV